ncbi:MAG: arginine--tRNA ligase [Candidatus Saccharibacteria bacterium]|nr:arginine--tRNA ligase [Candidatus Saccharibacteria bacterium]
MEEIKQKLKEIISKLYQLDFEPNITEAPKNFNADYSTNLAMAISKTVGKNPREIAEEIIKELSETTKSISVEIAGPGFLNFKTSDEYFKTEIAKISDNFSETIAQDEYKNQTIICEFSDPNPFKVLHVGHLYTSIVGDSISRLIEFSGGKVIRANFGGDVGLHVAKTLYSVIKNGEDTNDIEKIAKNYVEGTKAYEEDETAHAEITKLNQTIYAVAKSGPDFQYNDAKKAKIAKLYFTGRETSYNYFKDFYSKIGVKFDKYYPESTVAERGLKEVKAHPETYEESDGAIVYKGEKDGLHTRVFINKNGLPTYEAKDVGLIFTKYDDYKFDKSIVITGNDIIDYMKVVLTSISKYAPELTEKTLHLTHGNVRLPGNEKMSSRKGNFLKAIDVLNAVNDALKNEHETSDEKVSLGATKYAFLKYKIGGDIIFDPKESVKMTGNSGPYLQYSAVRASKIIGNLLKDGVSAKNESWELSERERELIKKIVSYPDELKATIKELSPNKLCNYLYELAQEFSRFYETTKVAGSEFEFERGQIVLAYLKVLTHGLSLLGIEVPERM